MAATISDPWPVHFSHADAPPQDGYHLTRIRAEGDNRHGGMTVIFMHGAGEGDGVGSWVGLWRSLLENLPDGTDVLLPSGPLLKPPFGKDVDGPKPGWIRFLPPVDWTRGALFADKGIVFGGIGEVAASIQDIITTEMRRPNRCVVLGGFSQGGAMALWAGVNASGTSRPAAIFSLSGYIPQPHRLPSYMAQPPPVLLMHGEADMVIPVAVVDATISSFHERGWHDVEDQRFHGLGHKVKRDELLALCEWLCQVCPAKVPRSVPSELAQDRGGDRVINSRL